MQKRVIHIIFFIHYSLFTIHLSAQQTEKVYLSGTGSDNTKQWEFMCTGGMNANKWTTIPVPSCWELQGFGKYDYGFAKDSVRGKEEGFYKYSFNAPASWKGKAIKIVFEGVMTDAEVRINRQLAGESHQGAFYAFKYEISELLNYGERNLLEVAVSKHSANESVNDAERKADFWLFGGIFRPVWLEVLPQIHIENVQIDAKADGSFLAFIDVNNFYDKPYDDAQMEIFDASAKSLGKVKAVPIVSQSYLFFKVEKKFQLHKLWSPESPNLYKAVFTIYSKGKALHSVTQKFGFRTVELKLRDGIYVNGVKVKMKGVNRHSFRPETGRTTSKKISIEDVLLMKDMNMNAVRMSHYPPDDHFLDVCDSLGLFVMDELAGWHGNYDTKTGTKLLKEMIDHDVNHPSIIMWANGNEGGHNFELDSLFTDFDIQERPGHGAGLEDYWEKMWHDPLSAGGFLWDFADNAVVRKDLNDSLDTDKHRGADGILGPRLEKEGSYYAIKEIWSPIYFEGREITDAFDGKLKIENRYHFTNINQCSFSWNLVGLNYGNSDSYFLKGSTVSPNIKPGDKGVLNLKLPTTWHKYDVLYVTAKDAYKREIFTWSFTIKRPDKMSAIIVKKQGEVEVILKEVDSLFTIKANGVDLVINKNNGRLIEVKNAKGIIPFNNGPVLQEGENNFQNFKHRFDGKDLVIESTFDRKSGYNTLQWIIYPSGWIRLQVNYFPSAYFTNFVGINFSFPEAQIRSVDYIGDGPYRVWKNRLTGNHFGQHHKEYNNTETGESPWKYPEFKGYHSNFYKGTFNIDGNRFTVVTGTEDLFMRLFTPAWKTDQWHNYEPIFPSGDISFMQGISSIGTKTQRNETTGPMGSKNIFYDYEKDPARALKMVLYFDFTAK